MLGKREMFEDVYGIVPQHLSDMVKAGLLEPESPVVETYTRRYHVWTPTPSGATRSSLARGDTLPDGRWAMSPSKGMSREPKSLCMFLGDGTRDRLKDASPKVTESS